MPLPDYDRREWHSHWRDLDKDCQDSRQEALIATGMNIEFKSARQCDVTGGLWYDPYTDRIISTPSDLDIDHIVPLAHAHGHGGATWPAERKEAFANDPMNLLPVDAGANRSKGARAPHEWMPPNQTYHCLYIVRWWKVKEKYGLRSSESELVFLDETFNKACYGNEEGAL